MSNTFANINNALGILKIYYGKSIVSQFNDEVPLYMAAEKGKEKWNGVQVNVPLKLRRNPGVGATSDGGNLPVIGKQTTGQAIVSARFNYLRFGITGPMIKASQGDKGSFISIMEFEMSEGLNDIKTDVERQLFFNGLGTIATVSANANASTVITCTGRTSGEAGNKYLDVGVVVDIYDSTGATLKASAVAITAVSGSTTATVTLDQAVTVASTDIVVRSGALNQEIQGLRTWLDGLTTTVNGIDRSAYQQFQGNSIDLASAQLTLNGMQTAYNESRRRGASKINAIFCDYDSERFYNKLLVSDKRYIGDAVKGDGTFTKVDQSYLAFAGVPIVPSKDCPGSEMFFITQEGWKKYVLGSELEWADESGAYLIATTGADQYEARLRLFANMFMQKPAANARLSGYVSP